MEQLILLIAIGAISLLHSWWKKRKGEGDEEDAAPWPDQSQRRPPVAPPFNRQGNPPPSKASNWEEELRRLLQGEEPARRVPPPIVVQQAPPPLPSARVPRPLPAHRPVPVRHIDPYVAPTISTPELTVLQSAQAFLHGSMAESEVAEHMQRDHPNVGTHQLFARRKTRSPEIQQAVSLVRSRQSQRAAILAGIILGPPKAMEG